jgi:ElaB/YqjD/DUF883 family membrane-anchored ribosome-binding protein
MVALFWGEQQAVVAFVAAACIFLFSGEFSKAEPRSISPPGKAKANLRCMNQDPMDELNSITDQARQKGREIAEAAQDGARDALSAAEGYVRENPWLAVGGAVAAGVALALFLPRSQPKPDRLHAVKDWLEDAYEKISEQLPDKSDVQSMAQSCGLASGLREIGRKLHLC